MFKKLIRWSTVAAMMATMGLGTQHVSAQEKTTIEFWYGLGSQAGEKMEEIIAEFNSSQDEVEVVGVPQADYSETSQKVQAAIAANKTPGAFIVDSSFTNFASKGLLADLSALAEGNALYDPNDYVEVFFEQGQLDGTQYGLPAYGTTQVMYYNKDVFEAAGVDADEAFASWENLAVASKTIQETGVDYGFMPMWGSGNLTDIALSNGGSFLSEDGKTVMINSEAWVQAWDFIRSQLHDTKVMGVNSGGQGWEYWYKTIDQVMVGSAGGYLGSSGDKGDLDFSYIGSFEQPGLNENGAKPVAGALLMAIPANNDEAVQQAAFKWISYFSSPEVSAKWSMAIGYIPVRKSALENEAYAAFLEENPHAKVPYAQALHATPTFVDPTGGIILDELSKAADKVELQNVSAQEALDEAQVAAQKALDEVLGQ